MLNRTIKLFSIMLALCFLLTVTACGAENVEQSSSSSEVKESVTLQDIQTPDNVVDTDKFNEYLGIDVDALETSVENIEEVPENVVLVAALNRDYKRVSNAIFAYNEAQSAIKVEVKRYEDRNAMLFDLVRGKGCDILVLDYNNLKILGEKSALEDLSPYFERSEKVSRDSLFSAVQECGTMGDKWMGVLPNFHVSGLLVEKGYTDNGGWTLDEYMALMDLHPEVPVSRFVNTKEYNSWFMNDLTKVMEQFVDWESRTCSFDSREFVDLITRVQEYVKRFPQLNEIKYIMPDASLLYENKIQVMSVPFTGTENFRSYKSIRDVFLENYDFVGYPNLTGEPEYALSSINILYSINGKSPKKEAAWSFLEYVLSKEYQESILEVHSDCFPARRDVVEEALQEQIEAAASGEEERYYNFYLKKTIVNENGFTQEDKERVLYVLDHTSGDKSIMDGGALMSIFSEEIKAFAAGDKTAEETAKNIQNRISLFLME